MAQYEVFIPAALESEFNVTLKVDADNWMAALRSGLKKLGDQGTQVANILVDIMDDMSIHVTDSASGRVFRIKEFTTAPSAKPAAPAAAAAAAAVAPPASMAPPAPVAKAAPAPKPAEPAKVAETPKPVEAKKPEPKKAAVPPPPPKEDPRDTLPRSVEQVVAPSQPVSGPIGRTRANAHVEDLLSDLFERVAEIEALEEPKALAFLLDLAMETIPSDAGSVFVSNLEAPELTIACARGPKARELEAMKLRMPMGVGIVGFCAQEAVSLAISDTEKDARFHREVSQKIGYPTRSILCAPMVVGGRTFGCLEIINKKGSSHFSDTELAALAYLAHQGARYLESKA